MSKRRELERRLRSLGEIGDIMGAMKNLSLIEMRKLTRFAGTQRRVMESLETAAADFFHFHPEFLASPTRTQPVCLLIGSERGFCGDFNELVEQALERHRRESGAQEPALITVGGRLSAHMAEHPLVRARLNGPTVVEEVGSVLLRLMEQLRRWQAQGDPLALAALYHEDEGVTIKTILPMPRFGREQARFAYPPALNLAPRDFLVDLVEQYLYASLHGMFYASLTAESRRRLQHMESAMQHIEKESAALALKRNGLRQEEITEEIEVIMLSADALKSQL